MKNQHILEELYRKFCTGIRSKKAEAPRLYLKEKGLDLNELNIGFNSGQFWHRTDDDFKQRYIDAGVLKESDAPVRELGLKAYSCFGTYAIVFPLKNSSGEICNLYSIRIKTQSEKKAYLYKDSGLYPAYPSKQTTRLVLVEDILSAATLRQAKMLHNQDSVLALHEGNL